jgi:hypothetical protein
MVGETSVRNAGGKSSSSYVKQTFRPKAGILEIL